MKNCWSIRVYFWLLAIAVMLPGAAVLIYSILSDARHAEEEARATTLSMAQLVASQTQRTIDDAEAVASRLANRPMVRALDRGERPPILESFLSSHPQFANITICDASGRIIHSAPPPPPPPPGRPPEHVRAAWAAAVVKNKRLTIGKPIMGPITGRWVCIVGYPILDDAGDVVGAVGLAIDLERLQPDIKLSSLPAGSVLTIIDEEGTIIARGSEPGLWVGKAGRGTEIVDYALRSFDGNKTALGPDGRERIYGFTNIPKIGWHVYVGIPTSFTFAAARANAWRATIFGLALLALVVAMVLLLGRRINKPVRDLSRAATAAAAGAEMELPTNGPTEIITVAEEFKRLLVARQQKEAEIQKLNAALEQRVRERTSELEKANLDLQREVMDRKRAEEASRAHQQELQDYIDGMSTMNAKVALDGTLLLVNKIAQQASGLSAVELMKTNFLDGQWWKFDPAVQARVRAAFARACAGAPVNYDEKMFVFGKVVDINFSLVPVRAAGDRVAYVVAEGRDITPLKLVEAALEGRTKELLAANKELEAFCYSVSHDLRGPLRTIGGFTKVLVEDHGPQLDATAHQYLERVGRGVERMGGLIDGLLELSSVSRNDLVHTTVDLSFLASNVMHELRAAAPERDMTFSVQPGLMAHGDAVLLRIAIENLLGNAWKFSRNQKTSRIEFGASEMDGETTFFVRDNGVGFEMKYVNKLFGPFERLHSSSEYEGHGIGLATVQRIIHRHGGQAWAESAPNQGAIFYFTLASDQITTHSA